MPDNKESIKRGMAAGDYVSLQTALNHWLEGYLTDEEYAERKVILENRQKQST